MAKRALSLDQQAKLDAVTEFDDSLAQMKRTAEAEIRRLVGEKLAAASAELDRRVRVAVDAGVPKEEFRRREHGLHTTNRQRVLDILARTESLATVVDQVAERRGPERHAIDADGYLVITPPREDVEMLVSRLGFEPDTVVPYSARFALAPSGLLDPVDGAVIEGTDDRNPVVIWTQRKENRAAALEWWKQHRA